MSEKAIAQCGHCRARFRVKSAHLGRVARCTKCGHRFVLAPKPTLSDSVVDWLLEDESDDDRADRTDDAGPPTNPNRADADLTPHRQALPPGHARKAAGLPPGGLSTMLDAPGGRSGAAGGGW